MKTKKTLTTALSLVAGLVVASVSALAHASDSPNLNPTDIRFTGDGTLLISSSSGYFWAASAADGTACPLRSLDVRKSWLSIAQASVLSGRKIHIVYNTCASGRMGISELWLLP